MNAIADQYNPFSENLLLCIMTTFITSLWMVWMWG